MIVQQKQHEAQSVKMKHMQEFVDKFRFNAKRASLVQSRIKAIERENIVEAVEEEREFSFSFADSGELGRPIIQLEGVTFSYGPGGSKAPLFRNVHKNIDQSSRVALGAHFTYFPHISIYPSLPSSIAICAFSWPERCWKVHTAQTDPR